MVKQRNLSQFQTGVSSVTEAVRTEVKQTIGMIPRTPKEEQTRRFTKLLACLLDARFCLHVSILTQLVL